MKPERKLDRRALRTRKALRDALVSLILEKGYEAVTVQDITDRADLNRGTLYLHYRDKQDLLLRSSEGIYADLIAQFEPLKRDRLLLDVPEHHLALVLEHVVANADFYRVMFGQHGVPAFVKRVRQIIAEVSLQRLLALLALQPTTVRHDPAVVASFTSGALMGVIEWWLETGLEAPPQALIETLVALTVHGVYGSAGLETDVQNAPTENSG